MSAKQIVSDILSSLPEDCTLDDIRYRLYVRAKIEQGMKDVNEGRTHSRDEAAAKVREWLASDGPNPR